MPEQLSDSRVQLMLTALDRWRTARYRRALTAGALTLISVQWAGQPEAVASPLRPLAEGDSLGLALCYIVWWLLLRGLRFAADQPRGDTAIPSLTRGVGPARPQHKGAGEQEVHATRAEYLSAFAMVTLLTVAMVWPTLLLGLPNAAGHRLRSDDALLRQPDPPSEFVQPPPWLWNPGVSSVLFDPWAYLNDQPHDLVAAEALRVGGWPLWNPYNGLGAPILANGQASPLFPLKLPLYLLLNSGLVPASLAFSYYLILRLWLAGCGTYLWARAAGLRHQAALIAALIFMFSGPLLVQFHNVTVTPSTVLPLVFWVCERFVRRLTLRAATTVGLAFAVLSLSGHIVPAGYIGVAALVYTALRARQQARILGREVWSRIGRGAAIIALVALGPALLTALPFLELSQQGAAKPIGAIGRAGWSAAFGGWLLPMLLHVISLPGGRLSIAIGPLAVVLAIIAILRARSHPLTTVLVGTLGASLLTILANHPTNVLVSVRASLSTQYATAPVAFALAGLAGVGLDLLIAIRRTQGTRPALTASLWPMLGLGLVGLALFDLAHDATRPPSWLAFSPLLLGATLMPPARQWLRAQLPSGRTREPIIRIVLAGAVLVSVPLLIFAAQQAYRSWMGERLIGTMQGPDGQFPWSAGRTGGGPWTLNTRGVIATLDLKSSPPTLVWWYSPRRETPEAVERTGSQVSFRASDYTYQGQFVGAFHTFFGPHQARTFLIELGLAALAGIVALLWRKGRYVGLAVVAVGAYIALYHGAPQLGPRPGFDWTATPAVTWLQQRAGWQRVVALGRGALRANTNAPFGLYNLALRDVMQPCRYRLFLTLASGRSVVSETHQPDCPTTHEAALTGVNADLVGLAGVRYVVDTHGEADPSAGVWTMIAKPDREGVAALELAHEFSGGLIYELPAALPRAYFVGAAGARPVSPDDSVAALAILQGEELDYRRAVLLETEALPWPATGSTQADGEEPRGEATVELYRHDQLHIRVVAPEPGYLVLSNLWYPGWRASVDNTPTDILPANYALQAVPVAAGAHTVTLRYLPWSFYGPLLLTLGGLVLSAILLGRRRAAWPGWVLWTALATTLIAFAPRPMF
ncbi:MAG: hypothetical protein CL878_02490 [Dehalococcoidia bacterium]|nr:hypothetical protein [Dehalococcoidia bacterium]